MPTITSLASTLNAVRRTAGSVAWERATRPRPTTLDQVPPSVDALTCEWLTAALCGDVPGAAVEHIARGVKDDGTSARRTITVTYNETGRAAALPEHLFTKSSPTFLTRLVTSMANLLPAEQAFYTTIRHQVDIEAPMGRYAAWDPRTNRSLFIMDDVTVTRGARLDTILTRETTREQAEDIVDVLATLHATYWKNPDLTTTFPWLMTPLEWMHLMDDVMMMQRNIVLGFRRAESVIPAEVMARSTDFPEALRRCRTISSAGPQTIVHTDVHAANWYVTGEGRMGLFDWQCMLHGHGVQDVTYALIGNLTVEQRRAWERDLIALYGERLAHHGVADVPSADELWLLHRQMVPHAMFMWLGTIGASKLQPEMQKPEISLANLERSSQAFVDLEVFAALGM